MPVTTRLDQPKVEGQEFNPGLPDEEQKPAPVPLRACIGGMLESGSRAETQIQSLQC